jgi:phosphate transport system permease protein
VGLLIGVAFLMAVVPLGSLVWTVAGRGLARLDGAFLTQTMRGVVGAGGGALHALVGTALITATAAVIAIPLGILTAIYLVEYGRGRPVSLLVWLLDVMAGIPSIVAGLFAYEIGRAHV